MKTICLIALSTLFWQGQAIHLNKHLSPNQGTWTSNSGCQNQCKRLGGTVCGYFTKQCCPSHIKCTSSFFKGQYCQKDQRMIPINCNNGQANGGNNGLFGGFTSILSGGGQNNQYPKPNSGGLFGGLLPGTQSNNNQGTGILGGLGGLLPGAQANQYPQPNNQGSGSGLFSNLFSGTQSNPHPNNGQNTGFLGALTNILPSSSSQGNNQAQPQWQNNQAQSQWPNTPVNGGVQSSSKKPAAVPIPM